MEKRIAIEDLPSLKDIFGVEDKNLRLIEKEFEVTVALKPDGILVKGVKENVENALGFMKRIVSLGKEGMVFNREELSRYLNSKGKTKEEGKYGIRVFSARKRFVFPKTKGQEEYITAMRDHDIVFSVGPAGTGKTYLTMAMAVNYLVEKKVRRIILTRPAIEAGESLGFLPGDMHEKLSPYLRPLYDALYDMMEVDVIEDYLETGIIEIAPLAYMRGRTLNNAFVILDEAQNCTAEQLKMFLTRLGFDSKTVITGDITQSDLPGGKPIGLIEAIKFLKAIRGIKFINLTKKDVVRHPLVQQIIQAYEDFYSEKRS
ncbi:MAG: PhoH family protein [Candidatus Omnitrophota bacterium]|nr:MAG: PhoH family protein [Candidatus Omnitrophota bacterium]